MILSERTSILKSIGPKRETKLKEAGIYNIYDLINYFPRTYINYENVMNINQIAVDSKAVIKGTVLAYKEKKLKRHLKLLTITTLFVENGLEVQRDISKFYNTYHKVSLIVGKEYFFYGTAKLFRGKKAFTAEEIVETKTKKLIRPVYSVIGKGRAQLGQNFWEKSIQEALIYANEQISNKGSMYSLYHNLTQELELLPLTKAYVGIHIPKNISELNAAVITIKHWEAFKAKIDASISRTNRLKKQCDISVQEKGIELVKNAISNLPFALRDSQIKALAEIQKDMCSPYQMYRLLQGDVGSGKTVVAILAMLQSIGSGLQAAMMVPTEMLASQHIKAAEKIFKDLGKKVYLLTSSTENSVRKEILAKLKTKEPIALIGTHALLQEDVIFSDLGLIVIDEQHKFGVKQRETLMQKKHLVDTLYMSATPIPRTMAFAIYRELDISTLEASSRVGKVKSYFVPEYKKTDLYNYLKVELEQENQAYVICPSIENTHSDNNESSPMVAVLNLKSELEEIFKDFNVVAIHGKLKENEKHEIMTKFNEGEIDLLVATSLVEVGIHNPNANILVINNCERFGLSQLHQFRGRVGRGKEKAQCFLMGNITGELAKQRIKFFLETDDGSKLAEYDFKLRGAGELSGVKQHGKSEFRILNPVEDKEIFNNVIDFIEKERI
ncbi:ATP-dependent DNA helicase RecG [Desulfitispora alkaliphila]|uniref:ATP-dependent DNA helicase RecG n=1 Tax=Desulfitispora alkaliphila TaxID=622674 RepID=UPI003D1A7A7B